jgi:hypothetical protein
VDGDDVDDVGGRVLDGRVDEVGVSLVDDEASVVDGAVVDGSVVAGVVVVDGSVVEGAVEVDATVVEGAVDDGGARVVEGSVEELSAASSLRTRSTTAPRAFDWVGVVVVVGSVEGDVAVDDEVLDTAFEISRPAPTSTPTTTRGSSTCAQTGRARKRCRSPCWSAPPPSGGTGSPGGVASLTRLEGAQVP